MARQQAVIIKISATNKYSPVCILQLHRFKLFLTKKCHPDLGLANLVEQL